MAIFEYKARNKRGEFMTGTMDAETADRVAEQLFHSGITPIDIREAAEKNINDINAGDLFENYFQPKVGLDELIMLCRQMRTLMKAGIPILKGLWGLAESVDNKTLKKVLIDIHGQLESGRDVVAVLIE